MNILQLTPGAGAMYCGNCLRDNALVAALRRMGHQVLMVPLYLPLTLDEQDQTAGTPVFFGGISVYLGQKSALFRQAPSWLRNLLASPRLLKWAAGRAARTRAADLGELTLSMLRGEEGYQAGELDALLRWLKAQFQPDVICLSNALLIGLARRLKSALGAPAVCMLQGEDSFLDALPASYRDACWDTVAQRVAEADGLIAPSRYFAGLMSQRLGLPVGRVRVIYNGISLAGFDRENASPPSAGPEGAHPPVLGFFARMCREKGLDTLVEAYVLLRRRNRIHQLRLRVGGSCGPADQPLVNSLRERLADAGLLKDAEFCPNLDRPQKVDFLRSLSVFSVPARYGEAFGLYVLESLAAGVPVVQPRAASFPELVEATAGGLLCAPDDPQSLADAVEALLIHPGRARAFGDQGRQAVLAKFSAEAMARQFAEFFNELQSQA